MNSSTSATSRKSLAALNGQRVTIRTVFAGTQGTYSGLLEYLPGKQGSGRKKVDGTVTVRAIAETPLLATHDHTRDPQFPKPCRMDGKEIGSLGFPALWTGPERAVVACEATGK